MVNADDWFLWITIIHWLPPFKQFDIINAVLLISSINKTLWVLQLNQRLQKVISISWLRNVNIVWVCITSVKIFIKTMFNLKSINIVFFQQSFNIITFVVYITDNVFIWNLGDVFIKTILFKGSTSIPKNICKISTERLRQWVNGKRNQLKYVVLMI